MRLSRSIAFTGCVLLGGVVIGVSMYAQGQGTGTGQGQTQGQAQGAPPQGRGRGGPAQNLQVLPLLEAWLPEIAAAPEALLLTRLATLFPSLVNGGSNGAVSVANGRRMLRLPLAVQVVGVHGVQIGERHGQPARIAGGEREGVTEVRDFGHGLADDATFGPRREAGRAERRLCGHALRSTG